VCILCAWVNYAYLITHQMQPKPLTPSELNSITLPDRVKAIQNCSKSMLANKAA